MKTLFNIIFILLLSSLFSASYGQLDIKKYAGKKYRKLYKAVAKDSNFVSCRILSSKPNRVTGVELFFKDGKHYSINFTAPKLNDAYTCESPEIRGMRIYVIHYYDGDNYIEGYYKRKDEQDPTLIKPDIQKVDEPESPNY